MGSPVAIRSSFLCASEIDINSNFFFSFILSLRRVLVSCYLYLDFKTVFSPACDIYTFVRLLARLQLASPPSYPHCGLEKAEMTTAA